MDYLLRKSWLVWMISSWLVLGFLYSTTADSVQPEDGIATKKNLKVVKSRNYMIAAANPYAVKEGQKIIEKGGNAIDALVTIQLILNLVEPESSGIGGGAFLLYYDKTQDSLITLDGRETAPATVDERLFFKENQPMKWPEAVPGGLSVGTPGTLKLLEETHQHYGKLSWRKVLDPAINLARKGFKVSAKLHQSILAKKAQIATDENARNFFLPDGEALVAGSKIKNLEFAQTLRLIQDQGSKVFYRGSIADHMIRAIKNSFQPGHLSKADLKNYRVIKRKPQCFSYREHYKICGMGPPTSGTITIGQILGVLENFNLDDLDYDSPEFLRLFGEASRLAYADRGLYIADPDFFNTPSDILLSKKYLMRRAQLIPRIHENKKILNKKEVVPGNLSDFGYEMANLTEGMNFDSPSTSHISIIDQQGNIVSMTTTIENGFGSKIWVDGFLLNNEMTDFSFTHEKEGRKIANRVEPGKRPRSSMAPLVVFKDGKPYMTLGSPGGSRIIEYVARVLIAVLDWGYDIQEAINLPNISNRSGPYDLEKGTIMETLKESLIAMGYKVNIRDLFSGLHGIVMVGGKNLQGGADPRREGIASGR